MTKRPETDLIRGYKMMAHIICDELNVKELRVLVPAESLGIEASGSLCLTYTMPPLGHSVGEWGAGDLKLHGKDKDVTLSDEGTSAVCELMMVALTNMQTRGDRVMQAVA